MRGSTGFVSRLCVVVCAAVAAVALGCSTAYGYGWIPMQPFLIDMQGVAVAPNGEVWATGARGTYFRSADSGGTWTPYSVATANSLVDVVFTSSTDGWLCAAGGGLVYRTEDGGSTWEERSVGNLTSLSRPFVLGDSVWIPAPGMSATIKAYTEENGWVGLSIPGATASLYGVCFSSPDDGFAAGSDGAIYRTENGGGYWAPVSKSGVTAWVQDVAVTDEGTVIAVSSSGHILRSETAGTSWDEPNPTNPRYSLYRVVSRDKELWATGWSGVLHSGDDGRTWTAFDPGDTTMHDVAFDESGIGYAVGDFGAFYKYVPPVAPDVQAQQLYDATSVTATWNPSADAHHYEVSIDGGAPFDVTGTSTAFSIDDNTSVKVAVRAVTHDGFRSVWDTATITNSDGTPTAPMLVGAQLVSVPRVDVSWGAVARATSYQYRLNGGLALTTSGTSVLVSGLAEGANTIEVRSTGALASSGWSTLMVTYVPSPATQTIILAISPSSLSYPKALVALSGSTGGHSIAATLEQRVGNGAWVSTGVVLTSDAGGTLPAVSRKVAATTQYRLVYAGASKWLPASSNTVTVAYKPSVKAPSLPSIKAKRSFAAKVDVFTPAKDIKGKVTLRFYKKSGSKYTYVKKVTGSRSFWKSGRTRYSGKIKLNSKGTWKVTATYEGKGYYADGTSSKKFKVK